MNTTLALPEALVREIERRAAREGRDFKDAVAELLRKGLAASDEAPESLARPEVKTHPRTGLSYIECRQVALPEEEMTPERVAELLLQQEAAWHHETG